VKNVVIGVLLFCGTVPGMLTPGGSVMAQGPNVPLHRQADLLIIGDHDGTVGLQVVNWGKEGLFTGFRVSAIGPEGERVAWSAVNAESSLQSTFMGYGRKQYLGGYGGFYRKYYDEDMDEGHDIYHLLDRMKQRYLFDLLLGVYHRGNQINLGLSMSLATRSINAIVGFPITLDTLRNG